MAKEKKGLGIGLDALFGTDELNEAEAELQFLPISKVEPRMEQPRMQFDEEALQELADSISRYGLIQPITARKLDSGYYQIIAGERRWRASRMAGLTEVPVRVLEADDRRTAELALVENLQREDLNPIEEAKGYQTLMHDFGLTQEETAKSVGRSRPAVANSLRLLSLTPPVMELVEKGELSAGHARALIPIENGADQLNAAQHSALAGIPHKIHFIHPGKMPADHLDFRRQPGNHILILKNFQAGQACSAGQIVPRIGMAVEEGFVLCRLP